MCYLGESLTIICSFLGMSVRREVSLYRPCSLIRSFTRNRVLRDFCLVFSFPATHLLLWWSVGSVSG